MTDKLQESLSALMDNEADELELRRLLKALPEDESIREAWRSYHLIRATLNQEAHSSPRVDIASRVHAALDAEAIPVRKAAGGIFSRTVRYIGQGAIAASVALVVLFTSHNLVSPDSGISTQISSSPSLETTGDFNPGEFTRVASFSEEDPQLDQEARDRLRQAVYREFEQNSVPYEIPVTYPPQGN